MKPLLIAIVCTFGLTSCSLFQKKFTIVFTHNTNGWFEDCGCAHGNKYGGLQRRAAVFNSVANNDEEALFFDSGDVISTDSRNSERDLFVIRMMKYLRYDAIGVGDQEFIHGMGFYKKSFRMLPMISSNVTSAGLSAKVLKRKDEQIAVISLFNPYLLGFLPDSIRSEIEVLPPNEVLEVLLKQFKEKNIENIVLLSNMSWEEDKKLAEKYPQLSLILSGHDQSLQDSMIVVNGTPIIQNGPDGERVSILEGYFSGGKYEVNHFNRIILNDQILPDSLVTAEIKLFKENHSDSAIAANRKIENGKKQVVNGK